MGRRGRAGDGLKHGGTSSFARFVAGLLAALLLCGLTDGHRPASAQPPPPAAPPPDVGVPPPAAGPDASDAIVLNFEGADIREVIHSLAGALGINYLIDPRVEGQVTIRTTGKIPRAELFPIFNQILRSIGIAAVRVGEVYNIVPIAEAKTRAIVSRAAMAQMTKDDLFVVELVGVKNLAAQEMATLIQPFLTPGGDVFPYPRANLLILTDIASNVDRLREMVQLLDRDSFKDLKAKIFKVKHASIEELGQELIAVLDSYGITGEAANERGVYAIPLVRLNSVAVLAFNSDAFQAVEYWLKLLDVPEDDDLRRTVRVYNVQNAKAADLAAILNELYGGGGGGPGGAPGAPSAGQPGFGGLFRNASGLRGGAGGAAGLGGRAGMGRGQGALGGPSQFGGGGSGLGNSGGGGGGFGNSGSSRGGNRGLGRGGGAQPAGVLGGAPGAAGGAGTGIGGFILGGEGVQSPFEAEVRVVADEVSNSLVILATKKDYDEILKVLRDLDVVPRQVVIEVLIAEVNLNKGMSFGVQGIVSDNVGGVPTPTPAPTGGATATPDADGLGGILQDNDITNMAKRFIQTAAGSGALTAFITDRDTFEITVTALATAGRAKVLASPHILTADNREASIVIGEEIPVLSSQANLAGIQSANGQTALVNNIQYRSTGVILNVLPQINADGLVNLQVRQEVSQVSSDNFGQTGSPSFSTREAETTAVVQNGDSLLLGGIIQETSRRNRSGVPYLMDIPILGRMFRFDVDNVQRVELIVLLTPHVVRTRREALETTQEYKDRLWDVIDDVERTAGLRAPTKHELYERYRMRSRTTTAERPRAGLLPNRDWEE
jgi:general secretion pathway protein D